MPDRLHRRLQGQGVLPVPALPKQGFFVGIRGGPVRILGLGPSVWGPDSDVWGLQLGDHSSHRVLNALSEAVA